ncbi:hypothetical protein P5673_005543 [Acropora cervicornis]|uniref:Uncharacterized protein n=1 Tax=Acropora cervicornis TaxID=6130 RepID=A0AAD9QYP1_ACRCE|nr:hypothetical protein P5673_005543 [Acropora cervicornis]
MSLSEEEVQFSDENSDESSLTSSLEYEIEHESDGAFASPSASEDEDVAAAFAEEPLADAEWTTQYERERKDNEELEKQLRDRLEGTVAIVFFPTAWIVGNTQQPNSSLRSHRGGAFPPC